MTSYTLSIKSRKQTKRETDLSTIEFELDIRIFNRNKFKTQFKTN